VVPLEGLGLGGGRSHDNTHERTGPATGTRTARRRRATPPERTSTPYASSASLPPRPGRRPVTSHRWRGSSASGRSQSRSVQDARSLCEQLFAYDCHEHRHSGIDSHPPASVYYDTAHEARALGHRHSGPPTRPNPPGFPTAGLNCRSFPPTPGSTAWIDEPATGAAAAGQASRESVPTRLTGSAQAAPAIGPGESAGEPRSAITLFASEASAASGVERPGWSAASSSARQAAQRYRSPTRRVTVGS